MSNTFLLGLELMGYGLVGVFTTLIGFILVIQLLMKIFPQKDNEDENMV